MKKIFFVSLLWVTTAIFAEAPIVDLNQTDSNDNGIPATSVTESVPSVNLSPEQRITRLEQQMNNFMQSNSAARIDQLQQQVNQLQGQLDQQTHQLQQLQDQQKSFYEDIDQRLMQLKTPAVAPNVPPARPASTNEQTTYQQAFAVLNTKKYAEAASSFQYYLKQFPQGQYAANAHYWLGEIYYLQNKPALAAEQFQLIVTQYPKDQKLPDALLKIAFIHDDAGKHAQAKQELQNIIKQFPGTPAAQLANLRLKTLQGRTTGT